MSWRRELAARLRSLVRRRVAERELDDELRFHLDMEAAKYRALGMGPREARRRARIEFGGLERIKEECRDQRGARGLEDLARDLRQAARRLLREPSFAVPAFSTLVLALAGVFALFAVVSSVLLRPLPYPEPGRLVRLWSAVPGVGAEAVWGVAKAELLHFEREARSFEALGLYGFAAATLGGGDPEVGDRRVMVVRFSRGLIDALRVEPARGRRPSAADAAPGAPAVAWLTDRLWRDGFGADPEVVGRRIEVDGRVVEVAGVMPPSLLLPEQLEGSAIDGVELWTPLEIDPAEPPQASHVYRAIGRLAPGVGLGVAATELDGLTRGLPEALPAAYSERFLEATGFRTVVAPLRDDVLGGVAGILWMLQGAALLVLLVAGANVGGLLVARAAIRQREGAVRVALGASRRRLLQEAVAEMLLLCSAAAVAGVALAAAALRVLGVHPPADLPRAQQIELGWEVWGLAALAAAMAALALGALQARRPPALSPSGAAGFRGALATAPGDRLRRGLVIAQVAISTVLLAGAALLAQSWLRLSRLDAGFEPRGVLTFSVLLPEASFGSLDAVVAFDREASRRLAALPGVTAVGLGTGLPLEGLGCSAVEVRDRDPAAESDAPCVPVHLVTPGHLGALGVAVRGRETGWEDLDAVDRGAVVSEAFARRVWPGEEALGRRIRIGAQSSWIEVVGVASDVHGDGLDRPPTEDVYLPLHEGATTPLGGPPRRQAVVVRTTLRDPLALVEPARTTLRELDPRVPLVDFAPMTDRVRGSLARRTFATTLLGVAAALAMALGAIGLYGVLSYLVARRRAEMGLRLALGARGSQLAITALLESLRLAAVGVALGAACALWATSLLRGLLWDVGARDPRTFVAVGCVLLAVAALAAWGPARRAARLDPAAALRGD
ncbi:MAG TPA: ADOP family duplicated permease [Thermoanaerobaculia bacterium]|nr:ADOP family duplicated permease [Thermoanaerobaculia bacterium]